jgi:hypothetical protein
MEKKMKTHSHFIRTGGLFLFLLFVLVLPLLVPPGLAAPGILVETSADGTQTTLSYPANALNYDKTSTILTQSANGIRWQANFANPAFLIVPRPLDWDGTSDVTMQLHFTSTTGTGDVQFFIRPRAFDPGDAFLDTSSLSGDPAAVTANNQVGEQVFTIPAARFGNKALWVITIQRQGSLETYAEDVILNSAGLTYNRLASPPPMASLAYPANALNYDKTSTILTQSANGIRWQANFANPAFLIVPRPLDWDGTSDVTMQLHFTSTTGTGDVQFFIRPRAFDPGDAFLDTSSLSGDPAAVTANNQVGEQVFTIPAARFGNKALWVITIQRQGSLETYAEDVILNSASLTYTSQSPSHNLYLPFVMK